MVISPGWPKIPPKMKNSKINTIKVYILFRGTTWPNVMFLALAVVSH